MECYTQHHCLNSFSKGFSHQLWIHFGFPPYTCKPMGCASLSDDIHWLFSLTESYFWLFSRSCVRFFPLFFACYPRGNTSVTDRLGPGQVSLAASWDWLCWTWKKDILAGSHRSCSCNPTATKALPQQHNAIRMMKNVEGRKRVREYANIISIKCLFTN